MTGRERLTAVLRGQAPDRVPFAPLIARYYIKSLPEMGIPLETLGDITPYRDQTYIMQDTNFYELEAQRFVGGDILYRHVYPYKLVYDASIKPFSRQESGLTVNGFDTPQGTIYEEVACSGGTDFITRHMINTPDELRIFDYVIRHTRATPLYDYFHQLDALAGDDGIVSLTGPLTPIQEMLQFKMGVMNTVMLLQDERTLMEEVFEHMQQLHRSIYQLYRECDALATFTYEDTSTTVMSPDWYTRYCVGPLDEYAEILHSNDKIHIVHMCGKISLLTDAIRRGRMDGIDSVCPPSTGDLEPGDALKQIGKVIIGGLNPVELVHNDVAGVLNYTKKQLRQVGDGRGFILSTGDSTAAFTPMENLKAIAQYMKEHGQFPLQMD